MATTPTDESRSTIEPTIVGCEIHHRNREILDYNISKYFKAFMTWKQTIDVSRVRSENYFLQCRLTEDQWIYSQSQQFIGINIQQI